MSRKVKIEEVYLEDEHWNHVCQATIPGAWVAIVNGTKQAFAHPWDYKTVEEARKAAEEFFV